MILKGIRGWIRFPKIILLNKFCNIQYIKSKGININPFNLFFYLKLYFEHKKYYFITGKFRLNNFINYDDKNFGLEDNIMFLRSLYEK